MDETYSEECTRILSKVPDKFILTELSIIYQEACGTLARKVGMEVANKAKEQLDLIIHPTLPKHGVTSFRTGMRTVIECYLKAA